MNMNKEHHQSKCPVCGVSTATEFIRILDVPIFCNVLWETRDQALSAPRGNIFLHYCRVCGHVYNDAFDPGQVAYCPQYENSLYYSPTFREYMVGLAERLIHAYGVRNRDIIEIGCGKGEFLQLMAGMGNNRCLGFDPSYGLRKADQDVQPKGFHVIRDYFSEKYSGYKADCIVCRQVLEHIVEPKSLLEMVRRSLIPQDNALVFFEVPNVMFTLRELGIWDLIYEHCGYFTSTSLRRLFLEGGFELLSVSESFGGQYLCIEAKDGGARKLVQLDPSGASLDAVEECVRRFSESHRQMMSKWNEVLAGLQRSGVQPVVWGGGSKGVTFLNLLKTQGIISHVVDINPRKNGLYVPGTGQQIISPDSLSTIRPEVVIAMNPLYVNEIECMLRQRGLSCRIMTA